MLSLLSSLITPVPIRSGTSEKAGAMADVTDPKIAEGEYPSSRHGRIQFGCDVLSELIGIAYEQVRKDGDDTTWLLLDYEVSPTLC